MKKNISLILISLLTISIAVAAVSCKKSGEQGVVYEMEVTPPELVFEADDMGMKDFIVETNVVNWTYTINYINGKDWILERMGVDLLNLAVDENTSPAERVAEITFTSSHTSPVKVTVRQSGAAGE